MQTATNANGRGAQRHVRYFRRTRRATWWLAAVFAIMGTIAWADGHDIAFAKFSLVLVGILFVWGLDAHCRFRKIATRIK